MGEISEFARSAVATSSRPLTKKKTTFTKPAQPSTEEMVDTAIAALMERRGSSIQAIKKYVSKTYQLDADKHAFYIKKYLKDAVAKGTIRQMSGAGARGSFKLLAVQSQAAVKEMRAKKLAAFRRLSAIAADEKPTESREAAKQIPEKKKPVETTPYKSKKTGKSP